MPQAKSLALLLSDLSIEKSHSRPYVSDDNPFSEAQFKTIKYHPTYPERFGCVQDARAWARPLFHWYNYEHYHTGLNLLTPASVHYGQAENIRQTILLYLKWICRHLEIVRSGKAKKHHINSL